MSETSVNIVLRILKLMTRTRTWDQTPFAGEGDIIAHDFHTQIELECIVDFAYLD